MKDFWAFASDMLRYRLTLTVALIGAIVSAGCFGAGIGVIPVLFNVILGDDGKPLPILLAEWDTKVHDLIPNQWVNAAPSDPFKGIIVVLFGILILTIIGASAKFVHGYFAMSAGIRTVADLRKRAFQHLIHLPLRTVVETGTADRMSRIVKDTNRLRAGFNAITTKAVGESLKGIASLFVAFMLNWQLTIIAIIGAPILAVVIRKFSKKVQKASKRALRQSGVMLGAMTEAVQGIRVVKVHTAEEHEDARFSIINNRLLHEELAMRLAKALSSPVVELLSMVGVIGIAALAAWYITSHSIDYKTAFATLVAVAAAGASLRPLTAVSTEVHESAAAAERLQQLLDDETENPQEPNHKILPPHASTIAFNHVSFTYPSAENESLIDISLSIYHGETVAFVGPNGSGKTTLLSLIPRLFDPDSGSITIDDIDLQTVQLKSLRDQIGVVTQETVIFHDTIANNIAYGAGESVSRDDIIRAAKRAAAHDFITRKPGGYDWMIGEQGVTISGGERQRLAIARAILRNPRILILDEATSMIDADSEAVIAQTLTEFCKDRTSLAIAHRLSTVVNADRIIVLNRGCIIDIGTHHELLSRCELYQQLCRTQLVEGHTNEVANSSE